MVEPRRDSQLKTILHSPKTKYNNSEMKPQNPQQQVRGEVTIHPPQSFRAMSNSNDVFSPNNRRDTEVISLKLDMAPPMKISQIDDDFLPPNTERLYEDPAVPVKSIEELLNVLKS